MTETPENIETVKNTINRERTNLLTVIAALAFLNVCMLVGLLVMSVFSFTANTELEAVSVALDDQRVQYYRCLRDEAYTVDCPQNMVSPPSRDIRRDLTSAGFSNLIYESESYTGSPTDIPESVSGPEAFGLLGRIIY